MKDAAGLYLKRHTERLIKDIGFAAACDLSGRSKATLGRYFSEAPEHADRYMPVDAVAALEGVNAALLVGANPRKEQPLIAHRLRQAALAGARVMLVNPVDYEFHLPVHAKAVVPPSHMAAVLAGVAACFPDAGAGAPEAVRRPWQGSPYHDAMPFSIQPSSTGSTVGVGAGVVVVGFGSGAAGLTVGCSTPRWAHPVRSTSRIPRKPISDFGFRISDFSPPFLSLWGLGGIPNSSFLIPHSS